MDDDAETYKLWRIRKTVMQVSISGFDYYLITVIHYYY